MALEESLLQKPEGNISNLSILGGVNFENGPFKIRINAEPVFTFTEIEDLEHDKQPRYSIEIFYQL